MYKSAKSPVTILDQFTPDILGVFWLTRESLSRELIGFDVFNYLFDGLISEYLYGQENTEVDRAHMFFTQNFNDKIFLAHLKTKDVTKSQVAGDIDEQISLIPKSNNSRKIIFIFDKTGDNWISEIKKRYLHFEFRELEA